MTRLLLYCLVCVGLVGLGCDSERSALSQKVPCSTTDDCPTGLSCLFNTCVQEGSLGQGETCTEEIQCGDGLICFGSICINGCRDIYHQGQCPQGQWCEPEDHQYVEDSFGFRSYVGECVESQCDPELGQGCANTDSCLKIDEQVGACIEACDYSITNGVFNDTCDPRDSLPHSCHVIGLNQQAGCLPSGALSGPAVGFAGCDTINRPCQPGFLCINVVCRRLCDQSQANQCPAGESCIDLEPGHHFAFCKAD